MNFDFQIIIIDTDSFLSPQTNSLHYIMHNMSNFIKFNKFKFTNYNKLRYYKAWNMSVANH